MQLSSAKSLSKKLRAGKFLGKEAVSRSFVQGRFWATARRGSLGELIGEQFFLTKHPSTDQCVWNHYLTN